MSKLIPFYVRADTAKRIKKYGEMGDSHDFVISKILDIADGKAGHDELQSSTVKPVSPAKEIDWSRAGQDARVAAGVVRQWIPDGLKPGYEVYILENGLRSEQRPISQP